MLNRVPLRRAGREVADRDLQPGFQRERGQLGLPRPGAVAVGAARVRGHQQSAGARVGGPAGPGPPAADRLHRERGGVMIGAHVHPAGAGGQVIDPVRDRLAQLRVGEVMGADLHRLAPGPPLPAAVAVLPDQLFFLGIHADHRIRGAQMPFDLLVDVAELRVPVRALLPLQGLGVALQAEPLPAQQIPHRVRAHPVPLAGQLRRQRPGRLGRPPQRRLRIAPLVRLHQGQQRRDQPRILLRHPLAAPARPARPAQRRLPRAQFARAQRHRGLADPGRPGHQPDPAVPPRPRHRPHQQPPLPLIQMREDRLERRRQHLPGFLHNPHTTPASTTGSLRVTYLRSLSMRYAEVPP